MEFVALSTIDIHNLHMEFMSPCINNITMTVYALTPVGSCLLMRYMAGITVKLMFGIGRDINLNGSLNLLWRRCKFFYIYSLFSNHPNPYLIAPVKKEALLPFRPQIFSAVAVAI